MKGRQKGVYKEAAIDDLIAHLSLSHQQPKNKAIWEDSGFARFSVSDWGPTFCSVLIFSVKAPQNISHTLENQISEPSISLYNYLLSKTLSKKRMRGHLLRYQKICVFTKITSKIEIPL